jgi:hypothetical protein
LVCDKNSNGDFTALGQDIPNTGVFVSYFNEASMIWFILLVFKGKFCENCKNVK